MTQLAVREEEIMRPLKILVPLIKEEIELGWEAGVEHYRKAGEMLLEAQSQMEKGEWKGWVERNFPLSYTTAKRYMQLAHAMEQGSARSLSNTVNMQDVIRPNEPRAAWHEPVREILTDRVTPKFVDRFAQERQDKEKEQQLMRKLANELIDIGYKVLATKLHPDKGGSQEAMSRLNKVKSLLKQAI